MSEVRTRTVEDIPFVPTPDDFQMQVAPFLAKAYEKYGPVFRINPFGFQERVMLVGPEANRFVLSSNRLKFSHKMGWGQFFGLINSFGDGLLTMDGKEHDQHRRMMNPAFTIQYMDRYLPIMHRIIRERVTEWLATGEIDIYSEARTLTFDIAAETLTGLKPGPEIDEFRSLYVALLLTNVETEEEYNRIIVPIRTQLFELVGRKIAERRAHPTDDILGMMVQARDDNGNALSDGQLIAHVNILLIAGHETSTSLVSWLLYLLVEHPDYLQRVLDEQAALGPNDDPTLEQIKQMKVLDRALSEAERLYPPVPNGPRGVAEDFEFEGYHIPTGTFVMYSIAASHLIPSIFPNPTKFDPDRFAPPREEDKKTPYALIGFGGGPRICIGINFAQVEIKALVSHVVRRTKLELVPDQQIAQMYFATGAPINGIKLRVTKR